MNKYKDQYSRKYSSHSFEEMTYDGLVDEEKNLFGIEKIFEVNKNHLQRTQKVTEIIVHGNR